MTCALVSFADSRSPLPSSACACAEPRGGGGATNHGRLGREELEGEVIGAIGQGIDLICNPLHLVLALRECKEGVGVEESESLRRVIKWSQEIAGKLWEGEGGAVDRCRDPMPDLERYHLYQHHDGFVGMRKA